MEQHAHHHLRAASVGRARPGALGAVWLLAGALALAPAPARALAPAAQIGWSVQASGAASQLTLELVTEVPANAAAANLAFNNTAVALRDATGALHLVRDDGSQGYHGRHDGSAWQIEVLPRIGGGSVSKVTLGALPDGELIVAWSEFERGTRSVGVARTEAQRSGWSGATARTRCPTRPARQPRSRARSRSRTTASTCSGSTPPPAASAG